MSKILTLDLGTSYLKAALFDREGALCALARKPTPIPRLSAERCELMPERFRQAVAETVAELARSSLEQLTDVAAVTFATQSNSFLLLDADDAPLTPIIIWADARGKPFEDDVGAIARVPGFRFSTGLPRLGWEYMAAKLIGIRRDRADLWERTAKVCLISDYLTHWLTGKHVTEAGTAGLTGTIDIHHLAPQLDVCTALGLLPSWMPAVTRAGTDLGPLLPDAAARLGLPASCRFVVGCLDQYAGAIGAGCLTPGTASETTGTVLATVRCLENFETAPPPDAVQGPSFDPKLYYEMLFGLTSANLLEWYRETLPERPDFETLVRAAADAPPGAEGLRMRPNAAAGPVREGFLGWDARHTQAHAVRCILETVALALARQVDQLWGVRRPAVIRSSGGAARAEVWMQIKADLLNAPFETVQCVEPTSLGAAILAGQALGWGAVPDLAERWVRVSRSYRPRPEMHRIYAALFRNARTGQFQER